MAPVDVNADPKNIRSLSPEEIPSLEASAALQGLVELFANVKGPGPYRRYVLERLDGALVFRQTEADAVVEGAIAALFDSGRTARGRCIIKLP